MPEDTLVLTKSEEGVDPETQSVTSQDNGSDMVTVHQDVHAMGQNISEPQALMNFVKGNIGTGMLSMPVVLKYCGLWTGFFLILFAGALSTYLMHVLFRVSTAVRERHGLDRSKMDYTDTVFYVFKYGPAPLRQPKGKIKHTVNVFLILTQIGFCCVYVLFITQNVRFFVRSFFPTVNLNFYAVGFVVALMFIPMCLCSDLRVFAHLSAVANVLTSIGIILIFAYLFSTGLNPISSLPAFTNLPNFMVGFSIVMFSFEGISLVLPIGNKMAHPAGYSTCFGVLNTGMICVVCMNCALAFFGFLKFGDDAEGSITLNIPEHPPWFAPVKPLFVMTMIVSYLLQFYIPALIFSRLMEKLRCHREASDRQRYINVKIMRVCLVLFTYVVVMVIPQLDLMISLVGALASSMLAYILPSVLELVYLWDDRHHVARFWLTVFTKHMIIILIGLVCFFGGTVATLLQLIRAFQNPVE